MADAMIEGAERLVVGDDGSVGRSGVRLTQALVPILIGLAGPILVVGLMEPAALRHVKLMALAVLLPIMLVAIALYIYSVLVPGEMTAAVVDRRARALVLVNANALSSRSTPIPFRDIARLRFATAYDDDGYASARGEVVLRSGDVIELPLLTSEPAVEALRLALAGAGATV